MEVETYEVGEVTTDGPDVVEEQAKLIRELDLQGQTDLIESNPNGDGFPYRKMTEEELIVYGAILPQKTDLVRYDDEVIPLRVLQVAAHAKPMFKELEVWHKVSSTVKDPLLVGNKGSSWNPDYFLLARWGDVLEPMSVLREMAAKIVRENYRNALKLMVKKIGMELDTLDELSSDFFVGNRVHIPEWRGIEQE